MLQVINCHAELIIFTNVKRNIYIKNDFITKIRYLYNKKKLNDKKY